VKSDHTDIGKRVREISCIHDLEVRRKVVDQFDDYAQILSYPMPPLELLAKGEQVEKYAKLVNDGFADICEKYPNLKIITHHSGGIAPMLEGRIGPGWDQIGARTSDEDLSMVLKSLKKRPLDYFKHDFYADTAVFGGVPATHAGLAFYDLDKIVFASDCPFDPERGTMYTRETLRILEGIDLPKADKEKIWHGNLEAITGVKFPS